MCTYKGGYVAPLQGLPLRGISCFPGRCPGLYSCRAFSAAIPITRPDMGYFRWSAKNPQGIAIALADIFAVALSIYIGWVQIGRLFAQQ